MFEKLMKTCFWPSIFAALVGGASTFYWIGIGAVLVALLAPMAVFTLWVVAHLILVPPSTEDLGVKLFGECSTNDGEVSA